MPSLGLGVVNIEDIHRAILDKVRHFPPHATTKSAIFRHAAPTKSAIFRHALPLVLCAFCARKTNFFAHKHFRLYAVRVL